MDGPTILLTREDLDRWQVEVRVIGERIAELDARRGLLIRRIEAATAFAALVDEVSPTLPFVAQPDTVRAVGGGDAASGVVEIAVPFSEAEVPVDAETEAEERTAPSESVAPVSWVKFVQTRLAAHPLGIVSHEFKEEIAQSALGERLGASDKGYYNAISRLTARGKIRKHNGRLFTPSAYRRYTAAVALGRVKDGPPPPASHSPMGNAIEAIIAAEPGTNNAKIISELRRNAEFAAMLHPKPTVVYNIVARLKKRNRVESRDGGLYLIAPQDEPSDKDGSFSFLNEPSSLGDASRKFA